MRVALGLARPQCQCQYKHKYWYRYLFRGCRTALNGHRQNPSPIYRSALAPVSCLGIFIFSCTAKMRHAVFSAALSQTRPEYRMPRLLEAPTEAEGRRRYCKELRGTPCDSTPSYASGPLLISRCFHFQPLDSTLLLLRSVRGRVPAAQASHALVAAAGCITLKCGCMARTCL